MKAKASISYRINLISRLQRTRFDARARSLGITRAHWRAISAISSEEGASQRRVAEMIEVGDVTAGRLIDRLVESGWVERRTDATDRRTRRLHLTPRAGPLLEKLAMLGAEEEAVALNGVTREDRAVALAVLEQVVTNLETAAKLAAAKMEAA